MERFTLSLMPGYFSMNDLIDQHLPTFETFLRPILQNCLACFVYGISEENINLQLSTILMKDKGKYRLDLTKEVISGYEFFWNSSFPDRGSIVILLDPPEIDFPAIFSNCFESFVFDNSNSGQTLGAVRFCKKQAEEGLVALCLSDTNGFQWIDVFASEELLLYEKALANCGTGTDSAEWKALVKPRRRLPGGLGRD
jgi:hypothetical protein